jgi:hypothetical protein
LDPHGAKGLLLVHNVRAVKRALIAGFLLATAAAVAIGWQSGGPGRASAGQPELVHLAPESLAALRAEFNSASDKVRIVTLFSPT